MKNKSKIYSLSFMVILSLLFVGVAQGATIIKDVFEKTYFIDATDYEFDSCEVKKNYVDGECSKIHVCGVVVLKGAYSLDQAIVRECKEITETKQGEIKLTFAPDAGKRYAAVSFLVQTDWVYNEETFKWEKVNSTVPEGYKSGEEAISLCQEGMMLKDNLCYPAQAVCLDKKSLNLCENPYDLYVLDYGNGFEKDNPSHYCADRDGDKVCDQTVAFECADTNNNGVCDSDDEEIRQTACVDENQNYVCDSVEDEGTFCRTNFQPVHVGEGEDCITYPNECFAGASGATSWDNGTCEPVFGNFCFSDSDCGSPCDGVVGVCKNPDGKGNRCFLTGECNPRKIQCTIDTDCPKSPCPGVSVQCTANNTCDFQGQCITKPESTDKGILEGIWRQILGFISGLFV